MPYLLALLSAVFYGAADFIGGLAARRAHTFAVVVVSGCGGLAVLAILLAVMPEASPTRHDFIWGGVAGFAGGIGVGLLYYALAIGTMSVVAPVTAVCGVGLPVVAGLLLGDRPSMLTLAGMALAIVAIVLVGQERRASGSGLQASGSAIGIALAAGVAIGFFYLALANVSADAGLWPLLSARLASVVFYSLVVVFTGRSLRMEAPVARLVISGGALDMVANALYILAMHGGLLSVVVVLSALYPAATVVLARIELHERLSRLQLAGVMGALVAVAMIVGGA